MVGLAQMRGKFVGLAFAASNTQAVFCKGSPLSRGWEFQFQYLGASERRWDGAEHRNLKMFLMYKN